MELLLILYSQKWQLMIYYKRKGKCKFSVFLASDPMELEFQLAVSYHVDVGNRSGSSGWAASGLTCRTTSSTSNLFLRNVSY